MRTCYQTQAALAYAADEIRNATAHFEREDRRQALRCLDIAIGQAEKARDDCARSLNRDEVTA